MIYQELKRRLFTRYVAFSIIGILLLTAGLSAILIGGDKVLPNVLKEEAVYSGQMTEDKLWLGLEKVQNEKSDEIKYKPLIAFISRLVYSYPGILYNENKLNEFPDYYAKNFYKCWEKKSTALIEKIPKNNQAKALEELDKVKTPFYQYEGYYLWTEGFNILKVLYLIIIFMVTFFASSTYSDSMEDGSMQIMDSTVYGKKMMGIRLLPVMIYGLILTLAATLCIVLILGSVTGLLTLKSSLKVFALFSIGNFTLGSGILLMFACELLGVLSLTTIMGWISYKTASTSLATSIGIGINMFYIIMALFIELPWKFSQFILNALPLASSQIINEVSGFQFDMGIWRPYAVMVSMVLVFIVFGMLLSHAVCREEI
ncbi:hypothetical protein [Clostridium estertheticum]|uniref:hypothetical protein n=1 Tax=Clostridium estertheticum TaxID=238834 RepID=UPI00124D3E6F|nr:hypothetical protein [Clostridium estertheticum]MBU3075870.1 hypothetical protein [Clostridium estertheticum]MBU3166014.1 hypothetical protein [Clostridium estertheticum]MBZ9618296.1 hypothetical protein [Clostridium estertheticum subsp. laramiense]MCB2342388.1 hypothetical protein [Clostridium estertheticum]WAG76204.1 hypothetical protein LL032_23755 [Clostridium estertheticum]